MAKPEKVRSSGAALLADGIQLKRVQSLSTDVDITRDQVLELANTGVVQFVETSPVVTISIDTNEWGSNDNLTLLSGKLITQTGVSNAADARTGRYFHLIKTPNNTSVTEQDMLDNYTSLAIPILEDQSATTVARTMVVPRASITGYSLNYDVGGIATENYTLQANEKIWYLNDWRDCRLVKLTDWHIGDSATSTKTYIPEDIGGAISTTAQSFVHLGSAIGTTALPDGGEIQFFNMESIGLIVNDRIYHSTVGGNEPYNFYMDTAFVNVRGSQGRVTMGVDATLPTGVSTPYAVEGDDVWLIFTPDGNQTWAGDATEASSADPGYALVSTAGSYGGAGKGFLTAYLFNLAGPAGETSTSGAGKTLRLQTIAVDLSFTSEVLDELGTFQSYGIVKQTPVPVNVTVTANDTDLEAWGRTVATSAGTGGANVAKELYSELFSDRNAVFVEVFKEKTKDTLLRTITSTGMSVIGESHNVAVGGQAAQEFTFTCDNIQIVGTGNEP